MALVISFSSHTVKFLSFHCSPEKNEIFQSLYQRKFETPSNIHGPSPWHVMLRSRSSSGRNLRYYCQCIQFRFENLKVVLKCFYILICAFNNYRKHLAYTSDFISYFFFGLSCKTFAAYTSWHRFWLSNCWLSSSHSVPNIADEFWRGSRRKAFTEQQQTANSRFFLVLRFTLTSYLYGCWLI